MMNRLVRGLLGLLGLLASAGCFSSGEGGGGVAACAPGALEACACPGGATGSRPCGAGGVGACSCAPADAGADASPGDPVARCERIVGSVKAAGLASAVEVSCDGARAWLTSDVYPSHTKMNGITGSNEQVPVPAPGFSAPIPLVPRLTDARTTRDNALGVAVNGVPIYDYTSQGELDPDAPYDPSSDVVVTGQLDVCGGHAGRGDDYHYHAAPTCLMAQMENRGPGAILGWAYDGFPIYGDDNPDGSPIAAGALDTCNGQPDDEFGFRYHTSKGPPYILQCLRGEVDVNALPKVNALRAAAGGGKPHGTPPKGGVQDLVFTESAGGKREMTYRHEGKEYFIRYEPAATAGCFRFTMNTVSQGSLSGEYCRD